MSSPIGHETPFYGGTLVFREKSHRYFFDGKPVPAVTTILGRLAKPALIQWAADCAVEHMAAVLESPAGFLMSSIPGELEAARKAHAKIRDAAGDVGTFIHDYARRRLAGEQVVVADADEPTRKAIDAFEKWRSEREIVPIALERRVFSKAEWYAGTCDFFGHIDGRLSILDFKTGKGIYDEFWLQTSGYKHALAEELPGLDVHNALRWIVRLDKKTGDFEAVPKSPSSVHTEAWLYLVGYDRLARMFGKEAA